jgi:hypothetical protein
VADGGAFGSESMAILIAAFEETPFMTPGAVKNEIYSPE